MAFHTLKINQGINYSQLDLNCIALHVLQTKTATPVTGLNEKRFTSVQQPKKNKNKKTTATALQDEVLYFRTR